MNRLTLLLALLAVLALCGCQQKPADTAEANTAAVPNSSATKYDDPSKAPDSGGYKISPSDPNDPKFKPDPKLGGGS
jgi:curli biogenesis system outer membrane secretion channel CsgG